MKKRLWQIAIMVVCLIMVTGCMSVGAIGSSDTKKTEALLDYI